MKITARILRLPVAVLQPKEIAVLALFEIVRAGTPALPGAHFTGAFTAAMNSTKLRAFSA